MPNIDIKNLMLLKEPYEIVLDYFKPSSSHFLNNMNLSMFRTRLFILFLFLAVFKIITSNMRIIPQLLNILLVGLLGIILIEALIRTFCCYTSIIEKNGFKGLFQFMLFFIVLITILGVF
tara:strand:+ start:158 stop:517 length:360 start_codon:yes stop_codon:yes gene_type:complete